MLGNQGYRHTPRTCNSFLHGNNDYANAAQRYVIRTLPDLLLAFSLLCFPCRILNENNKLRRWYELYALLTNMFLAKDVRNFLLPEIQVTVAVFFFFFFFFWYWYIYLQLGWYPVAVVQYTFTHKQYTGQHKETEYPKRNIHNNKNT